MSVLVHAELVQALAGNAVIAKTPTQGGCHCLTLAHALMARAGLPVTLLSGAGAELAEVLVSAPSIGALAFVGGPVQRRRGRPRRWSTPASATSSSRRASTPGASGTSPSGTLLAAHIRKGFEYGKQRCTAYPRFVVQRRLVDEFLDDVPAGACTSLRFGHPLAVADPGDPLPELDFGPLITARQGRGAAPTRSTRRSPAGRCRCYRGTLGDGRFLARPGHLGLRRAGRACWSRPRSGRCTTPSRSARSTRSCGRHRGRAARRDERLQRRAGRQHRLRRPDVRRAGRPSSCRRSRSASTSRAAAATARSSSAASARRGRARSSAATCWSTRSRSDPRATPSGCTATSRTTPSTPTADQ